MVIKRGRGGRGHINKVKNLSRGAFYLERRGRIFQTKKCGTPSTQINPSYITKPIH